MEISLAPPKKKHPPNRRVRYRISAKKGNLPAELPDEIVMMIFDNLRSPADAMRFMASCKRVFNVGRTYRRYWLDVWRRCQRPPPPPPVTIMHRYRRINIPARTPAPAKQIKPPVDAFKAATASMTRIKMNHIKKIKERAAKSIEVHAAAAKEHWDRVRHLTRSARMHEEQVQDAFAMLERHQKEGWRGKDVIDLDADVIFVS